MRVSLRTKVLVPGLVATLFLLGVMVYNTVSSQRVMDEYANVARRNSMVVMATELNVQVEAQASGFRGFLLTDNPQFLDTVMTKRNQLDAILDAITPLLKLEAGKQKAAKVASLKDAFEKAMDNNIAVAKSGDKASAVGLLESQTRPAKEALAAAIVDFSQLQSQQNELSQQDAADTATSARWIGIGMTGAATLLALALSVIFAQAISKPVVAASVLARRLAEGDLTVDELKASSNDEVGDMAQAMNTMLKSLRGLITDVVGSAQTVASSAEDLSTATQQVTQTAQDVAQTITEVARGASNQSESVRLTDRTVEELRQAIAQIAAGAQEQAGAAQASNSVMDTMLSAIGDVVTKADGVQASAERATETALDGKRVVSQTQEGMQRIRASVGTSAELINELGRVSDQIGAITQTITGIADQTNLLALNAAIEAARAGEHGRGFAVVADEVRKLAERAGNSAKEIAGLISKIQEGTNQAVRAMGQGTAAVEEGSRLAAEAEAALSEINEVIRQTMKDAQAITGAAHKISQASQEVSRSISSVAAISEEYTAATEQMAAGSHEVTRSVTAVAATAEENAAAAEEVSAAVEELNATMEEVAASSHSLSTVAQNLQKRVSQFKV